MSAQFKPNTTVSAVIHCQGKYLIVEELDNNNVVFNQPAGHLEADENLLDAMVREIDEETGLSIQPNSLCGIYYHLRQSNNTYYLRVSFICELEQHLKAQPKDSDIIRTHWLSKQELEQRKSQLRSPLVLKCIEDYEQGHRYPLTMLHTNVFASDNKAK
ncbi:NUDIX hydrolase [Thalassotalea aquiviva]|uniref:NUDIX hydrolase n=1 Tax=Thalassotalea aquiviva TaxID=3242415 RepID=UPI00352BC691